MMRTLLLARRYMVFHRWKTVLLIAAIALPTFLPVAIYVLLQRFQGELFARATATPAVVGAKGSRFDLALHALYFQAPPPNTILMSDADAVRKTSLARAIPLHIRDTAKGFPVVGTTLEYFDFRDLRIDRGQQMTRLGDCVLGAEVARQLGLQIGGRLLTDSENVFDIAGDYPLNMRITGILRATHSADDRAVFVDLKTAWIIQGIGHGHQDLTKKVDQELILEKKDNVTTANAALPSFNEINDNNIGSFHFHGDRSSFPLTAVIAVPDSTKSKTLLEGRYLLPESKTQMLLPEGVVTELMQMVFRFKRFFDANTVLVAASTVLFIGLVVLLSLRLRRREMQTMFKLGCSRLTVFWLQATELACVLLVAAVLVVAATCLTVAYSSEIVQALVS